MISVTHYDSSQSFQKTINKHRNILIIGEGATDYQLNQITSHDSIAIVEKLYGHSELSKAFSKAKEMGVQDIFLVNSKIKTDYIALVDAIKQYDFAYIVPLGIKFSDVFFNPELNRPMFYSEFYLETIGATSSSTIFMTEPHASLYEDIDHMINDLKAKITSFKSVAQKALKNGRNLCLVANNLKDEPYAHLIAACAICTTEFNSYPQSNFGTAIFEIDDFDVKGLEFAYFKNNTLVTTSLENLKNFRTEQDAAKLVNIDRVIKYIERELDFSDFKGKLYTDYIKLKIYNKLKEFLDSIINVAISAYEIKSVEFVSTAAGVGSIVNTFSIQPIESIEEFDIAMEV